MPDVGLFTFDDFVGDFLHLFGFHGLFVYGQSAPRKGPANQEQKHLVNLTDVKFSTISLSIYYVAGMEKS